MRLLGLSWTQLGLVFAVAGGVTLVLYLLRQQRRVVTVPSLWLWQTALGQRPTARFLSRLKHLLSLLLALVIVAALVLALGDPRAADRGGDSTRTVLLIDASPSMGARDVFPNRLAVAQDLARGAVLAAAPDEPMLVAQVAGTTTAMIPFTQEREALLSAVEQVALQPTEADLATATAFTRDVLGEHKGRVILFSDGRVHAAQASPHLLASLELAAVGKGTRNLALGPLSVRRYPLDKDNSETLVEARNAGPEPQEAILELRSAGHIVAQQTLTLPPHSATRRIYENLTGIDRVLEARIRPADGGAEALEIDSRAYASVPPRRRVRVLCVTGGSLYLQAALLVDEYLEVDTIAPAAYRGTDAHDVVIFDDFVPQAPPGVPALYIHPGSNGPGNPLEVHGEVQRPFFDRLMRGHPLLRWTALADVNVARAAALQPRPGDEVVGGDQSTPLLVAGTRDGVRFVALAFRLEDSDLPLRVAFPLLLLNVIDHFVAEPGDALSSFVAGHPATLAVAGADGEVRIQGPSGPVTGQRGAGVLRFLPIEPGIHVVPTGSGAPLPIAVNLASDVDPAIAPTDALAGDSRTTRRYKPAPPRTSQAPRTWLLLLAAALLLLEWWTFHRRWTV